MKFWLLAPGFWLLTRIVQDMNLKVGDEVKLVVKAIHVFPIKD